MEIYMLDGPPIAISATAIEASRSKEPILKIWEKYKKNIEEAKTLTNKVISFGHKIPEEFTSPSYAIERLTRLAALYFWAHINIQNLIYCAGIETSLRHVKIEKDQFCEEIKNRPEFLESTFQLYQSAIAQGVPIEDARYFLPEGISTRIVFSSSPRYIGKLSEILKSSQLPELQKIGNILANKIKELGYILEPEKPKYVWHFWEGLSDTESSEKIIETKGSLSMLAQLVRQRQLLCHVGSLEDIASRAEFVVPPSFSKELKEEYLGLAKKAVEIQKELLREKNPEFTYFLLLGQVANIKIETLNMDALKELSYARCCGASQWEIRQQGLAITNYLSEVGQKEIGPRCYRENICKEPGEAKNQCPVFKKTKGHSRQLSLKELSELLSTPYEIIKV